MANSGKLNIVLTGGGTGGHLYPALAVAELLQAHPEVGELLYIGDNRRIEAEKVPQLGLRFEGLTCSGMPRGKQIGKLFNWLVELFKATQHCKKLMERFQPDAVLATGGYATAPVLLAALWLKLPYVIHEPDARPGLVNKAFARWANQVTAAFEAAKPSLKNERFTATGNPLRSDLGQLSKAAGLKQLGLDWNPNKPVLLVLGGSLGARTLNTTIVETLPTLTEELGLKVLHQTGPKLYEETLEALGHLAHHPDYCVRPYFDTMPAVWAAGDFVLCRAGSLTLSEVTMAGLPSILVPYPHAAANHQAHNAKAMQEAGASLMMLDSECDAEHLLALLKPLLHNQTLRDNMAKAAKQSAKPNAARDVLTYLLAAAKA